MILWNVGRFNFSIALESSLMKNTKPISIQRLLTMRPERAHIWTNNNRETTKNESDVWRILEKFLYTPQRHRGSLTMRSFKKTVEKSNFAENELLLNILLKNRSLKGWKPLRGNVYLWDEWSKMVVEYLKEKDDPSTERNKIVHFA